MWDRLLVPRHGRGRIEINSLWPVCCQGIGINYLICLHIFSPKISWALLSWAQITQRAVPCSCRHTTGEGRNSKLSFLPSPVCAVCSGDSLVGVACFLLGPEGLLQMFWRSVFATVCVCDAHLEEQSVLHAWCLFCERVSFLQQVRLTLWIWLQLPLAMFFPLTGQHFYDLSLMEPQFSQHSDVLMKTAVSSAKKVLRVNGFVTCSKAPWYCFALLTYTGELLKRKREVFW